MHDTGAMLTQLSYEALIQSRSIIGSNNLHIYGVDERHIDNYFIFELQIKDEMNKMILTVCNQLL